MHCLRRSLASALALASLACSAEDRRPPNILLVTLDTTRADHLGLYGYARPTSPNLDALARRATVYERAYSTSSWTLPAHASLFTGLLPRSHGAYHDPAGSLVLARAIDAPEEIRARRLAAGLPTAASLLRDAGYATAAFVAGPWLRREFGLDRGFEHYDDAGVTSAVGRRAEALNEAALAWLAGAPEPFFLFLNYFDPHVPYDPPPAWRRSFLPPGVEPQPTLRSQAVDLYDAEILYMDAALGRLVRAVEEHGLWPRTWIAVTGDHGELLGERGDWGHERFLWEPLARVPLIVKPDGPEGTGERHSQPVSLTDLLPMILERAGIPLPEAVATVRDLPPLAQVRPMMAGADTGEWQAIWRDHEKLLLETQRATRLLFDVVADPAEERDLAGRDPERAAAAERALREALQRVPEAPAEAAEPGEVRPETRRALEALGYMESDGAGTP